MTSARMQDEFKRGVATAKAGNARLATQHFQRALELAEHNTAEIWIWLAWLADSPGTAAQCLECALAESPGHPIATRAMDWSRHMASYEPPSLDVESLESPLDRAFDLPEDANSPVDDAEHDQSNTATECDQIRTDAKIVTTEQADQRPSAFQDEPCIQHESPVEHAPPVEHKIRDEPQPIVPHATSWRSVPAVPLESNRPRSTDDLAELITDRFAEPASRATSDIAAASQPLTWQTASGDSLSTRPIQDLPALHTTSSTIDATTWRETFDESSYSTESSPPAPARQNATWRDLESDVISTPASHTASNTTPNSDANSRLGWRAELLSRSQRRQHFERQDPEELLAHSIEELASVMSPLDRSLEDFADCAEADALATSTIEACVADELDSKAANHDESLVANEVGHDAPSHDGRPLVLVVDDSPTVRKLVTLTLERHGYRVIGACDGVAAIREIATQPPQLVLLDINMPRLDGYKLCKLIKKHESTRAIPVVMLAGKDGMFDRLRGRLVGCSDYITKPFDSNSLVTKVGSYLPIEAETASN